MPSNTITRLYFQKLKDPRWQKLRLQILERDQWTCQECDDKDSTLHVHHKYYLPNSESWDAPLDSLITLCEDCHEEETELMRNACRELVQSVKQKINSLDIFQLAEAIKYYEPLTENEMQQIVNEYKLGFELKLNAFYLITDLMSGRYSKETQIKLTKIWIEDFMKENN